MSPAKFDILLKQELAELERKEIANMERILAAEHNVMCLTLDDDDDCHSHDREHDHDAFMAMAIKETTMEVALDSGSVAKVLHPDELPGSTELAPTRATVASKAPMGPI